MQVMELSVTVRQLIDARLDSIERALMAGGMPRGDRSQIVSAIEEQIVDMLNQQGSDEPTREDVLQVLAQIDPPEAYLDVNSLGASGMAAVTESGGHHRPVPTARQELATRPAETESAAMGIVGLVLTGLLCVVSLGWWIFGYLGMGFLIVITLAAGICNVLSLIQVTAGQRRHPGFGPTLAAFCCLAAVPLASWLFMIMADVIN